MKYKMAQGYGQIEVLITIAIVGMLTMIVYPNYQNYLKNPKRIEMMVELQHIATKIHGKSVLNGSYHSLNITSIFNNPIYKQSQNQSHYLNHKHNHNQTNQLNNKPVLALYPENDNPLYAISLTPLSSDNNFLGSANWRLIATPLEEGLMHSDGELTLNAQGVKCHRELCQ